MKSNFRITTLVENTVNKQGLFSEHGLSLWLELDDKKFLFDTGQSEQFVKNAHKMQIDLKQADAILLSHGHYDHTGGLVCATSIKPGIDIYAHEAAFNKKFAMNPNGTARLGSVKNLNIGKVKQRANLIKIDQPTEIHNGLYMTGPIPRLTDFEDTGGPFYKDQVCQIPDEIIDDQAAFLVTDSGTIVILGCAHSGVINTLKYILQLTSYSPIKMVIGGMHLVNANDERIEKTITGLKDIGVEQFWPCHCTGIKGIAKLWEAFPGQCHQCATGTTIEIE